MMGLIGMAMAALLVAAMIPHRHAESAALDSDDSCQACQFIDGVCVTPPVDLLVSASAHPVAGEVLVAVQAPRRILVPRSAVPRAPPIDSASRHA